MVRALIALFLTLLILPILPAQSAWFPFTLPWDDDSKTIVDASDLLIDYPGQDPATVIDERGFVQARGDGHFYFQRTGRRARFWGVNFVFNADFPPCPDEPLRAGEYPDVRVSDKVARRLAKLGVNVVRFHHMDTSVSPRGIWDPKYYPNDTQHLDAGQLRRLDYLIYQLRRNGIYVNLNLKVGRHFGPGDGLADTDRFTDHLKYFQGVSHFNPRMIELQQDYARQLLTHRNPYTGRSYAEDPAIVFIEIANEDSLFGNLSNDGGLNCLPDVPGSLPDRYSRELDALWNRWLSERYVSRQALENAWAGKDPPMNPADKMRNGGFENGMSEWRVQQLEQARAVSAIEAGAGPDGSAALRVEVISDGTNWHVQAMQERHAIEKDRMYAFSFYARAQRPAAIALDIMKGASPWQNYGLSKTVQLTADWQKFEARFRANETDSAAVRPTFELGAADNTIWIDRVEFRESAPKDLETGESFTDGTVRRLLRTELGGYTQARTIDLFRFYSETDESYFTGMMRFLKQDLSVKALITGTAPWWAWLGDTATQARLDYVDSHYYWDHPSWSGVPAWSPTGWKIKNQPWINQLHELGSVASQAVEGRPFTVSEFNHVFPNRYALEGPLLMAAVANLQDWDAVYLFDYADSAADFDDTYTNSFFSMCGNPVKSAQLPIASRIFLRGQSSVAKEEVTVELNRDELALGYAKGLINGSKWLEDKGLDPRTFLKARQRIRTFDLAEPVPIRQTLPSGNVASSNGELLWNRENEQASWLRIHAAGVQGAIGFLKGIAQDFGDWGFQVGAIGPDHLAVLLQARDAANLREARHMILSVWTEHQNTDMVWNDSQTSVDNRWGLAPTLVRPAQLQIDFKSPGVSALRVFPLDEKGNRQAALPVQGSVPSFRFEADTGRDRTVWYELEMNDPASAADFIVPSDGVFQLATDGASDRLQTGWMELEHGAGANLRVTSLLEYSSQGALTSLVRLPTSSEKMLARVPLIRDSFVDTGIALLNGQVETNQMTLRLLDSSGVPTGSAGVLMLLKPGETRAFFAREIFAIGAVFEGVLEVRGSLPFHSLAMRGITNAAGDFSMTPYPADAAADQPQYFAHLAADASYSSEVFLWNATQNQPAHMRLEFFTPLGQPVTAGEPSVPPLFTLIPGQMRRITLPRSDSAFYGYARLTRVAGAGMPSATAIVTRWEGGQPMSEIGIPATTIFGEESMLLAERADRHTALALLNPNTTAAAVELIWMDTESVSSQSGRIQITLQPGEKQAFFLYEKFPNLPSGRNAVLRMKAVPGIATLALCGVTNSRGEFLMAALSGGGEPGSLQAGSTAVLPRFATGAGYRTLLYLLPSAQSSPEARGRIRFYDSSGLPLPLLFR